MTEVEWVNVSNGELFGVQLAIAVEDRQGILADITSAISNLKTNIRESRSKSDSQSGKGIVEITIDISDVKHLQKVIHGLKAIRGIQDVERISQIP
jgi:GTP pyrophosphokinase